jgi:hypothetical protein
MAVRYQLVLNCVGHPELLARFWAEALGYHAMAVVTSRRHAHQRKPGRYLRGRNPG